MNQVIIYLRVSTPKQKRKTSLVGQEIEIREFASGKPLEVMDVYRESSSATGPLSIRRRPALRQAIARSRATGWPILVTTPDRFCRNVEAFDDAMKDGPIDVRSISTGGLADLNAFRAGVARAEFDSKKLSEGTKRGQRAAVARGKKMGSPCLDQVRPRAMAAIQKIKADRLAGYGRAIEQARAAGNNSARDLADWFNKAGLLTARGLPFGEANMRRIMRNLKLLDAPSTRVASIPSDSLFGPDHRLSAAGEARVRRLFGAIKRPPEEIIRRNNHLPNEIQRAEFVEKIEKGEAMLKAAIQRSRANALQAQSAA